LHVCENDDKEKMKKGVEKTFVPRDRSALKRENKSNSNPKSDGLKLNLDGPSYTPQNATHPKIKEFVPISRIFRSPSSFDDSQNVDAVNNIPSGGSLSPNASIVESCEGGFSPSANASIGESPGAAAISFSQSPTPFQSGSHQSLSFSSKTFEPRPYLRNEQFSGRGSHQPYGIDYDSGGMMCTNGTNVITNETRMSDIDSEGENENMKKNTGHSTSPVIKLNTHVPSFTSSAPLFSSIPPVIDQNSENISSTFHYPISIGEEQHSNISVSSNPGNVMHPTLQQKPVGDSREFHLGEVYGRERNENAHRMLTGAGFKTFYDPNVNYMEILERNFPTGALALKEAKPFVPESNKKDAPMPNLWKRGNQQDQQQTTPPALLPAISMGHTFLPPHHLNAKTTDEFNSKQKNFSTSVSHSAPYPVFNSSFSYFTQTGHASTVEVFV
jgi:hypothetical protein